MDKKTIPTNEELQKTIDDNNEIVKSCGKDPLFEDFDEFDRLMKSDETVSF